MLYYGTYNQGNERSYGNGISNNRPIAGTGGGTRTGYTNLAVGTTGSYSALPTVVTPSYGSAVNYVHCNIIYFLSFTSYHTLLNLNLQKPKNF